jgi:hypothetical protein
MAVEIREGESQISTLLRILVVNSLGNSFFMISYIRKIYSQTLHFLLHPPPVSFFVQTCLLLHTIRNHTFVRIFAHFSPVDRTQNLGSE